MIIYGEVTILAFNVEKHTSQIVRTKYVANKFLVSTISFKTNISCYGSWIHELLDRSHGAI